MLSGGLDSVVNLKCAIDHGEVTSAITFDYGQAAFENEAVAASLATARYNVPHRIVPLPWYKNLVANPVMGQGEVAACGSEELAGASALLQEAWIPNRNCVFLAIGGAYAEALGAGGVVAGFNREEAEVFPDNSREFLDAMGAVLRLSTLSKVEAVCYTIGMTKGEIVKLGLAISAPLDLIYSCYRRSPRQEMCGLCQSCVRVKAALGANGLLETFSRRFEA
jgi:7-cyano-7-deazaguanine synthase